MGYLPNVLDKSQMQPAPQWLVYAPILASFISLFGGIFVAFMAARWAVGRQTYAVEQSTVAALHSEVLALALLLERLYRQRSAYDQISVDELRDFERRCPVYSNYIDKLGSLKKEVVDDVVYFYSVLSSLEGANEFEIEGKHLLFIERQNVGLLLREAQNTLDTLEHNYQHLVRKHRTAPARR